MIGSLMPLLPLAMVGTDRHAAALPAWPGEIGQLVARIVTDADNTAMGLLNAAAVLATCELAGAQGVPWTEALPNGVPPEAAPALPQGPLLASVTWALHEGPTRLQIEVCIALARNGWRMPPLLLPHALELGRRSLALRPFLASVIGERGLWLAGLREDWGYAAGVGNDAHEEARWTEGSIEQRRAFLRRERSTDATAARARLMQSLGDLTAKERADLVAVLVEGLGPEDEPLLDSLRADRSREVRQIACGLLLRMPASAHSVRATARVASLLRQERVLLRKRWLIDAPTAVGSDWKDDNVDADRPKHESLGERAWWLYQCVRQVPLRGWEQHLNMTPAELLRWANTTDWTEALVRGWRDVLLAAPVAPWCEALLDAWPDKVLRDDPATILALLPAAARERHWQRQLGERNVAIQVLLPQMLAAWAPGETLSSALSTALVDVIVQRAQSRALADDYALRGALPELCTVLLLSALDRLVQLPRHAEETASFANTLQAVAHVIGTRQALHTLTMLRTP